MSVSQQTAQSQTTLERVRRGEIRHDWTAEEARALFELPFNELIFAAQTVHRQYFDPNEVQVSTLLSIKTGGCPEDCAYCPQSARYDTGLEKEKLMDVNFVVAQAKAAKAKGATRFCMGAAYRSPTDKHLDRITDMISQVRALGMETCATLGMVNREQAEKMADAGLDYYNHNIDTAEDFYGDIITTRTFDDRMDTLENVRQAGLNVCCGGIVGMGEETGHRADMLRALANLPQHPGSVPINQLVQVPGTPLYGQEEVHPVEFVRTIAAARLMMPASHVRLSAGRTDMNDETQALCFLAGANSIFYGDKLLTTDNPEADADQQLFQRLGLRPEAVGRVEERRECGRGKREDAAAEAAAQADQAEPHVRAD
ncbi:biotin synthase [Natronospira proteinivora]|uniref:Biotin synthase n=1 Tax=Natronospira proteinivora TaxID=1807133 RepID=A0ABT1G9I0_9GAMM|nr:biotin synthase BioB [Natronospira proteinivora]MCP1727959.1 biotin synthase [Natronospira proteinivora]